MVEAIVHKESPDTKLGIGLTDVEGQVYISKIAPDGLFGNSDLKAGQRLVSIGGTSTKGLNKTASIKILKASSGKVSVLTEEATIRVVTVTKDPENPSVGIGLRTKDGTIVIGSIKETSIFHNTELAPGQRLISINKSPCKGLTQSVVAQLFKNTTGELRVVVEDVTAEPAATAKISIRETAEDPAGSIVVNANKDPKNGAIGIGLKNTTDGAVIIGSIKDTSIFSGTALSVGQRVVSVNKTSCKGMNHHQVVGLFKVAQGALRVAVMPAASVEESTKPAPKASVQKAQPKKQVPKKEAPKKQVPREIAAPIQEEETFEFIEQFEVVTVAKESADAKLGIGLVTGNEGKVMISKITKDGAFASCGNLEAGCRLVSINDKSCDGLDKTECITMLKEATGELKVCVGIQQKVLSFIETSKILYGKVADESVMVEMGKQVEI